MRIITVTFLSLTSLLFTHQLQAQVNHVPIQAEIGSHDHQQIAEAFYTALVDQDYVRVQSILSPGFTYYACGGDSLDCHSASFETNDLVQPDLSAGYLKGGLPMYMEGMKDTVISANITMDPQAGIGKWTEQDFFTALTTARKPDGTLLRYPMMPYTFMDSTDASAIYAYLQSVKTGAEK